MSFRLVIKMYITYTITQQACVDLDFYLNQLNIDISNVYKGMYNIEKVNGKLHMVARDHNHISMTYNRTALKNQGLEDPKEDWTWNDFKEYCRTLTITEDGGSTYTHNSVFTSTIYPSVNSFSKTMEQNGIDWDLANLPIFPTHAVGLLIIE